MKNLLRIGRKVQKEIMFSIIIGKIIKINNKKTKEVVVLWEDGEITYEFLGRTILYHA